MSQVKGEGYGDGLIQLSDKAKEAARYMAPQGIIVSAGLAALDMMTSHGIGLGHMVWFIRQSPWRIVCGQMAGRDVELIMLRSAELAGSFDTASLLKERRIRMKAEEGEHRYISETGEPVASGDL